MKHNYGDRWWASDSIFLDNLVWNSFCWCALVSMFLELAAKNFQKKVLWKSELAVSGPSVIWLWLLLILSFNSVVVPEHHLTFFFTMCRWCQIWCNCRCGSFRIWLCLVEGNIFCSLYKYGNNGYDAAAILLYARVKESWCVLLF